jgi:ElaB/YqjD/DUF883 family membrane-anchored ribosome-binding protein
MPDSAHDSGSVDDLAAEIATLRADIARLAATVTHLVRGETAAIKSVVGDAAGHLTDTADGVLRAGREVAASALDLAATGQQRARQIGSDVGTAVDNRPFTAIAIAAAVGFVVGWLTRPAR